MFATKLTAPRNLAKPCMIAGLAMILAACAGGNPRQDGATPTSTSGFAGPDDRITLGTSFVLPDSRVHVFSDTLGTGQPALVDVAITINSAGQPEITRGNKTFVLDDIGDGGYFIRDQDTDVILLRTHQTTPNVVETVYISFQTADDFTSGYVPFGFNTDPAARRRETGSATFGGQINVQARQVVDGELLSGFSMGSVELDVNFDARTVGGNIVIDRHEDNDLILPDVTLSLDRTRIADSGFTGEMSLTAGELPEGFTLTQARYNGQFYGATAQAVAGMIDATVTTALPDAPIDIQGAFAAQR